MTTVRLLVDADRHRLATALHEAWDDGVTTWVLDATGDVTSHAARTSGLVAQTKLAALATTDRVDVELPAVPDGTATIVTSSGTTGPPKILCLPTAAMDASGRGAHARLGLTHGDRWLLVLPLHHVAGQSVLWRARMLDTPALVQDRLDVVAANTAGADVVSLVPTQLHRVVAARARLHARVLLGGAAISPTLLADAGGHVAGVTRSYGLTETCGGCVYDGVAFPDVEVTAREGLLGIRGPVLASGHLTAHGLVPVTDHHGWLWTNDLGSVDDGIVSVTGRADDVIVTGGVNVNPATVEVVLEDHPGVERAGVVGLPDPEWGQQVTAAIVRTAAPDDADLPVDLRDELTDLVRTHLGSPAVPRRWVAVESLPTTSLGKIARTTLRASLS